MIFTLLLLLLFLGYYVRGWAFHRRPNSIIYDGDGTIVYFDPWKAIDEWLYDHVWSRR